MKLTTVRIEKPETCNVVLGQSHFIKTVEDIQEAVVNAVPGIRFGVAFCEASGQCLVRAGGTDPQLVELAARNALAIGAGHSFLVMLGEGFFPINILNPLKLVPEICRLYCATANPVEVIVAETEQGRGILGVVDGAAPRGIGRKRTPNGDTGSFERSLQILNQERLTAPRHSGEGAACASSYRGAHWLMKPPDWIAGLALLLSGTMVTCDDTEPRPMVPDAYAREREAMVRDQLESRDIRDSSVLGAMREVPRHCFVLADQERHAYRDQPLPIGHGQTISQPYIVAFMTEQLRPRKTDRVLEIGTGSGYQAAVLARLVTEVFSVEIVEPLAERARRTLEELGHTNVHVRAGDGYQGWAEAAPFDAIIVTCAPDHVPQPLVDQLREGGRMMIPVGERGQQQLVLLEKREGRIEKRAVLPVRFVPMTGEAEGRVPAP